MIKVEVGDIVYCNELDDCWINGRVVKSVVPTFLGDRVYVDGNDYRSHQRESLHTIRERKANT